VNIGGLFRCQFQGKALEQAVNNQVVELCPETVEPDMMM